MTTISGCRSTTSTSKRSTIWPDSSPITPASIPVAHSEDVGVIDEPVEHKQVRRSEPSTSVHSVDRRDMECCRMRQVAVNFRDLRSRWLVPEKGYSAAQISGGHH